MADANTPRGVRLVRVAFVFAEETCRRMVGTVDDLGPVLDDAAGGGVSTRGRLREADETESRLILGDVADVNSSNGNSSDIGSSSSLSDMKLRSITVVVSVLVTVSGSGERDESLVPCAFVTAATSS